MPLSSVPINSHAAWLLAKRYLRWNRCLARYFANFSYVSLLEAFTGSNRCNPLNFTNHAECELSHKKSETPVFAAI
jgi:hypothetical protein